MDKVLSWLAYPSVLVVAITLHIFMIQSQTLIIATYIPVFVGVIAITLLEMYLPERKAWHPQRSEIRNDATYMVAIQILLPRFLAFSFVLILLEPLQSRGWIINGYWPHQWPVGLQVIMMILIADFFRYWLHRFAHENGFMWRFHAVHHSVPKLYWLNVGRFHYIDKSLQFLFDALPFMLLGVNEVVLALYFVFYSINGFFQHSNIKLHMGPLNYIISTAELHRWHHSTEVKESNTNYGNNIILWDLAFGTWFLPKERKVGELGLHNRKYPCSFLDQLKTPYVKGINDRDIVLPGYSSIFRNWLIKMGMIYNRYFLWNPLEKATVNPRVSQCILLKSIISEYSNTGFGRKHRFEVITDYETYADQVPIQTYEDLRPFIEEQQASGSAELTPELPRMYAVTSGTTGKPKLIPILDKSLQQQRRTQRIFSYLQYRQMPEAFDGKLLGIMGAPVEGRLDNGIAYGSVSGLLYLNMPRILHGKYVVPSVVFDLLDYELKYLLILRLAIAEPNITYMCGANPSTFMKLQTLHEQYCDVLINDVKAGGFFREADLPEGMINDLGNKLMAKPERASELQALRDHHSLTYATVWPHLSILTTWTGGSCGVVLDQLRKYLPKDTKIFDLGYIASEFRGTIPVDYRDPAGIPLLKDNFYEFVLRNDWESGKHQFLLLDQLEQDTDYYIFITTQSGLFRYQMDDIVRVSGNLNNTPLLRFIQKGKGITSITGEKIYENQVLDAIADIRNKLNMEIAFFILLADRDRAAYDVYIESDHCDENFAKLLDNRLCEINLEYESKRKSGRLGMITAIRLIQGTGEAYKQFMIDAGQREGQYKPVLLQYRTELEFPIQKYISH